MTDTATSEPAQAEAPQPIEPDVKESEAVSDQPTVDQAAAEDDRDAPDLSLKTPGLSDKNNNLKVELADEDGGVDQTEFYSSSATFEDLGLSKALLDGLYNEMGFKSPSGIQATTLPLILAPPYRHLIAQGHNGCGKTTCFALAMLSRVDPEERKPQAICMCPTRELVVQNLEVVRKMGKYTGIEAVGVNELRMGRSMPPVTAQIVIGTAGRITNLISSRKLVLDNVRVLVFDEADEMMKVDGFKDSSVGMIQNVRKVSEGVQILLFSATFGDSVKSYVTKIMPSAHKVFVEKEQLSLDVIKQYRVDVNDIAQKDAILQEYILKNADKLGQTIIFVASRRTAQALYQSMLSMGVKCLKLSGDMQPEMRDQAVLAFRQVHAKILIATDVIARGFDVSTVTLVVNYDLPVDVHTGGPAFDTYLHRIGRSGRFGRKGAAFNFVKTERTSMRAMPDVDVIEEISRYFKREIPSIPADDEEAFIQVLADAGLAEQEDA